MAYSTPGFTVSWSLFTFMSIVLMVPSSHLILCHPLLFLRLIFPSIWVFSNKSAHHIAAAAAAKLLQSCPTLCDPTDCSTPGSPVLYYLPELAPTYVHWVGDAIPPSYSLLPPSPSPSPSAFNLFQHQGLFQWIVSSNQVAKVLELPIQHQSFQWIFRTDFP